MPSKSIHLSVYYTDNACLLITYEHPSSSFFSIRLLGNIVGIDEKVAVDGNDSIEKSSFKLSPAAARASSTVPKTKKPSQKAKTPSKRLFSHQSSVSNVSDLRLHKKGRKDEDCIVLDSDSDNDRGLNKSEQKQTGSQTIVTPSPHPSRRQTQQQPNNTPLYNSSRSSSQQGKGGGTGRTTSSHFATNPTSGKNRVVRNKSSSWFQQKKQQKTSQSSAFNSPKENPFSSYSFDPNSIEKNLDSQAVRSKEPSIFPSAVATSSLTVTKPRNNRTFRTPASRRKNVPSSSRISSHDLLQRKATELNQQTFPAGNFTQDDFGNYETDQFSQPHQQFGRHLGHEPQQFSRHFGQQQQQFSRHFGQQQQQFGQQFDQQQQYVQPQRQPTFREESFDQQTHRPGTSTGSVMTSNRFMNMPQQQFVEPQQQFGRSQHFNHPQHSSFHPAYHEESFDQGYSIGGHDFPQQMHYHQDTTSTVGSVMTSNRMNMPPSSLAPSQQFTHPQYGFSQQVTSPHFSQPQNYHEAADHHGCMRSAPVQNPYGRPPRAAGSVANNPYRQQRSGTSSHQQGMSSHHGYTRIAPVQNPYMRPQNAADSVANPYGQQNHGPPSEVVVHGTNDESASQFEDAFFS